jgi:cyclase
MKIPIHDSFSYFPLNKHIAGCFFSMVLSVLGCRSGSAQAQPAPLPAFDNAEVRTVPVSNGIYMLSGRGANIGVFTGEDGILLVNDSFAPMHQKIVDAVAKISGKPIHFVINTDWHDANTDGNALMGKLGVVIVAHDAVRSRLSTEQFNSATKKRTPAYPKEALPVVTYSDSLTLHFNGDDIYLFHPDAAHSDSDSVVYFRGVNVLQTGDLYYSNNFPFIDLESKGSVNGVIVAVERMLKLVKPDTKIIPGRGPIATVKQLAEYRTMLATVRDRILAGIRAGETLDQIIASKPTAEFDEARKGSGELVVARGPADFVRLLYQDLSRTAR